MAKVMLWVVDTGPQSTHCYNPEDQLNIFISVRNSEYIPFALYTNSSENAILLSYIRKHLLSFGKHKLDSQF